MFKRRDIPPVLLLLLLIILVMLTLSQILVVHNGRYGKNVHNMRKLQLELRQMDVNLHALMMQNVPSIELSRRLLQNEINSHRVAKIMAEASKPNQSAVPPRARPGGGAEVNRDSKSHHLIPHHTRELHSQLYDHHLIPNLESSSSHKSNLDISLHSAQDGFLQNTNQETIMGMQEVPKTNFTSSGSQPSDPIHHRLSDSLSGATRQKSMDSPHNQTVIMMNPSLSSTVINPATNRSSKLNYCPSIPPDLTGHVYVDLNNPANSSEPMIIANNPDLLPGGVGRPHDCVARHKVVVILPYRDREMHLAILLSHLHPILQRQQLDYRIVVVEQYGSDTFNKARIMNIAFVEALKLYPFQCAVFHDVDLVPEDDRNMYSCPALPRHMSVAIDEMGYKLAYQELVGGVLAMRTEHFQKLNGYSNLYWGWGAEDDDMAYRIMYVGLKITRPPEAVARYKMIKHTKRKPSDWRKRAKLLYTGTRRFQFDGLNSLQYKLVHIEERPLFTHILVDIGKPPRGFR